MPSPRRHSRLRPDRHRRGDAPAAQQVDHALRRRHHPVEPVVEALLDADDQRLEKADAVIAEIGFEARVDRCHRGDAVPVRPFDRGMAQEFGRRAMDDVGRKRFEVAAYARGKPAREPVFVAPRGQRHRRHVDQIAGRREGGSRRRRRIDAQRHARRQQVRGEQVQRLIGAVADIIIIAREQRDAEIGNIHQRALTRKCAPCQSPRVRLT